MTTHLLSAIIPAILGMFGLGAGKGAVRFVQEGDRGVVKRFGKVIRDSRGNCRILEPGWNWIVPGVHKVAFTHVRQRTMHCGNQQVTLADKTVFTVDAVLIYRVGDTAQKLYQSLFEVTNLDEAVRLYCIGVLREVVQRRSYDNLLGEHVEEISEELKARVQGQLEFWGVEALSFKLADLSPYADTIGVIQSGAAAQFRAGALVEAAELLGYGSVQEVPSAVAAALIGVPVVASVQA